MGGKLHVAIYCFKASLHQDILSSQSRAYGISRTEAESTVHMYSFTQNALKEFKYFVKPLYVCICMYVWEK